MERTITLFVERSRQLLADFSSQLRASDSNAAAQREFIATFTRMIEDFLDALSEQQVAVDTQLAGQLLECCAQMGRLGGRLSDQDQDQAVLARVETLQRRLAGLVEAPVKPDRSVQPRTETRAGGQTRSIP